MPFSAGIKKVRKHLQEFSIYYFCALGAFTSYTTVDVNV